MNGLVQIHLFAYFRAIGIELGLSRKIFTA